MPRNTIVLIGHGRYIEGVLASGQTPKPGQCVSLKSDGNYEVFNNTADGDRSEVVIVVEDQFVGQTITTAYAASTTFRGYIPVNGDELNMLVASGENIAIKDKLMIDEDTGKLIETTGTPESEPFIALESSGGALGSDTHVLVRFTGL